MGGVPNEIDHRRNYLAAKAAREGRNKPAVAPAKPVVPVKAPASAAPDVSTMLLKETALPKEPVVQLPPQQELAPITPKAPTPPPPKPVQAAKQPKLIKAHETTTTGGERMSAAKTLSMNPDTGEVK